MLIMMTSQFQSRLYYENVSLSININKGLTSIMSLLAVFEN